MAVTPAGLHPPEAGLVSGQLVPFKVKAEERELREASGGGGGEWQEEPALEESQEDWGGLSIAPVAPTWNLSTWVTETGG